MKEKYSVIFENLGGNMMSVCLKYLIKKVFCIDWEYIGQYLKYKHFAVDIKRSKNL